MAQFWHWCVRAPLAVVAILALGAGFYGVFEWALSMPLFAVSLLLADAAHHLGIYAGIRRGRRQAKSQAAILKYVREEERAA